MKDDFELITREFRDGKDIKIYPISDVHLGASEHMATEWAQFCEKIANDPRAYVVLVGDLINNATRSSVSNVFEETLRPRDQKRLMCEMLEPIRDKIICAVSGNHERRSLKDADDEPTYDIMCKLDLEDLYRQNAGFIKINFGTRTLNGYKRPSYTICITHGSGGGIYTGAGVNRTERFGYYVDGLDLLITGHTHKPVISQPAKLVIDPHNNKVTLRPFKVVTATSWLSYGGYAMQKMLQPASFCPQVITLSGDHKEITVTM